MAYRLPEAAEDEAGEDGGVTLLQAANNRINNAGRNDL
jgi:hypothetical protein